MPTKEPIFSAPPSSSPSVSLQPIEEIPPKLQDIMKLFQGVQEPKAKYGQLLFYGRNLNTLESQRKTNSDSVVTKRLAALLVQGLSGQPLEQIVRVSPDFVVLLGLQTSLTPARNNGFLNVLKLMQRKALQLYVEAEEADDSSNHVADKRRVENPNVAMNGDSGNEIEDISHQHAGHAGVKGTDGDTYFNIKVVSQEFEGKSFVKRHRLIYSLLQDELQSGLHALSIAANTPAEVDSL
ncbi:UNVERIFIED_CONTAM: SufE-like protein 1, chloroplastic/mitochondrial [Sesamum radiatum]|uniref:SufE-like protein 1, chloroplastic/mitochondrial n=1 Tax=Sesamum radiatum TaxID=300843 RepID=A0AAW2KH18_SESRA